MQPPATKWTFPDVTELPIGEDLAATGADLESGTLLRAYSSGFFPMPINRHRLGWFHPDPRGIIPPANLRVSRSLRRSVRRYETTINTAFDDVIEACADPSRPLGWIDNRIMKAYCRLHRMGWAHSIEVWDQDGLAGGLYGISIGGFFAGESMFHHRTDASKVALVRLVDELKADGALLDVQWVTPHLESLGAIEIGRIDYCVALNAAMRADPPQGLFETDVRSGPAGTTHS